MSDNNLETRDYYRIAYTGQEYDSYMSENASDGTNLHNPVPDSHQVKESWYETTDSELEQLQESEHDQPDSHGEADR